MFTWERAQGCAASNLSAVYVEGGPVEVLINGTMQGRKMGDIRGASGLSRRRMWSDVARVLQNLDTPMASYTTYAQFKEQSPLAERQAAKSTARSLALRGWQRNGGDEGWTLDS